MGFSFFDLIDRLTLIRQIIVFKVKLDQVIKYPD